MREKWRCPEGTVYTISFDEPLFPTQQTKNIYIYIGVRARGYSHRRRADIIQYNVGPSDIIWSPRSQPDSASD